MARVPISTSGRLGKTTSSSAEIGLAIEILTGTGSASSMTGRSSVAATTVGGIATGTTNGGIGCPVVIGRSTAAIDGIDMSRTATSRTTIITTTRRRQP